MITSTLLFFICNSVESHFKTTSIDFNCKSNWLIVCYHSGIVSTLREDVSLLFLIVYNFIYINYTMIFQKNLPFVILLFKDVTKNVVVVIHAFWNVNFTTTGVDKFYIVCINFKLGSAVFLHCKEFFHSSLWWYVKKHSSSWFMHNFWPVHICKVPSEYYLV